MQRCNTAFTYAGRHATAIASIGLEEDFGMNPTNKGGLYGTLFATVVAGLILFFVYVGYQEIGGGHYLRGARALIYPVAFVVALVLHFLNKSRGKVGAAVAPAPAIEKDATSQASASSAPLQSRFNFGTIVFGAFSAISLLVCLAKGIVPIYLGESVLWAAVAWFWHKKSPWSDTATGTVLLCAVGVAAGEGFVLGRQWGGSSYTYLTQGDHHIRVNAAAGRTDVLAGSRGWEPISFDRKPAVIPADETRSIVLSNGSWKHDAYTAEQICLDVQNDSDYVLQQITINVSLNPRPPDVNCNPLKESLEGGCESVVLTGYTVNLLDVGKAGRFCGTAPRPFPTGATWTYGTGIMKGWKR